MSELIERKAALDALDKRFDNIPMEQTAEILMLRKDLRELPTIQPEKAQLSKEGTTSDLISRQAARHALCKAVHKGEDVPCENQTASCLWTGTRVCDFVREIDALPTIQPEERKEKRMETHACDLISRQEALDALDDQIKKCCKALGSFSLSDVDKHAVEFEMASLRAYREMLENLPTVQPEPTDEQVLDYCKKRCLHIVTADVFQSTHLTHKVSFGDKDHVWIDGKQYISLPRFQEAVKEAGPKEGEWVQIQRCARDAQPDLECPFCKHRIGWWDMGRYCAGCGAKLKGGAG